MIQKNKGKEQGDLERKKRGEKGTK